MPAPALAVDHKLPNGSPPTVGAGFDVVVEKLFPDDAEGRALVPLATGEAAGGAGTDVK